MGSLCQPRTPLSSKGEARPRASVIIHNAATAPPRCGGAANTFTYIVSEGSSAEGGNTPEPRVGGQEHNDFTLLLRCRRPYYSHRNPQLIRITADRALK